MSLRAGSYLPEASDPEIGHVDIGGTHIAASVSTMVVFLKLNTPKHTHTHIQTHRHTHGRGGGELKENAIFSNPSVVSPPIPCCMRNLVYVCAFSRVQFFCSYWHVSKITQ